MRQQGGLRDSVARLVDKLLPRAYYVKNEPEIIQPKAPPRVLRLSGFLEAGALVAAFTYFIVYFSTQTTPVISTSKYPIPGQDCAVLNPKQGTMHYSNTTSENAQFARPTMSQAQCQVQLHQIGVCNDGVRFDFLQMLGVTNFNNSQYYSSGYLSFTPPSAAAGLTSGLAALYNPSVSFPKPDFASAAGTFKRVSGWNVFDTKKAQFSSYPQTYYPLGPWNERFFDSAKNKVYSSTFDFDLSGSSVEPSNDQAAANIADASSAALVKTVQAAVHDGTAYGLEIEAEFSIP